MSGEQPVEELIEVTVSGLMIDPLTNTPIVILKTASADRLLPIWIGPYEAQAIALKRENVESSRPMTHDLLSEVLARLGASLEAIVITDLRDNTFYAILDVRTSDGGSLKIDSRPSDAIALALRAHAVIRVMPQVFDKSSAVAASQPAESEERLRHWFETVDPDEFSKYKM